MTNVTTTIPYGKLILSDINVRKRIPERHIAAIAASIAEHGLIHPLIVSPATPRKTKYAVHAGGLRWRAIGQLIEAGTLPKDHAVEVKIYGDEGAAMREISLIENLIRENMSPAEECTAYRDIVADGASVEDVARRFSVTVRHVNGRLRLADLAPPIFAALSDDEITLDVAAAYGSTSDHTRQLAVWESVSGTWQAKNPDAIRRAIAAASIEGDNPIALLVGEADYVGGGGRIERDLFASAGEGCWVDGDLLREMAMNKLTHEAEIAVLGTKLGWVKPLLATQVGWQASEGLHHYYPRYEDPSAEAVARIAEIDEKLAELEVASEEAIEAGEESGDHSEYDRIEEEMEGLTREREGLARGAEIIPDEDRPHIGAFMILDEDGAPMLSPHYYTSVKPRAAGAGAKGGAASGSSDKANEDPANEPYPRALIEQLAKDRRDILALHVALNPALALDLAIFTLCRSHAGHLGYDGSGCSIRITDRYDPAGLKDIPQGDAAGELAGIKEGLETVWAREHDEFASFLAFRALDDDMKASWLGFAVSQSLRASLMDGGFKNPFQTQLGALIGIDPAQHWRPGAERFFDRLKKSSILSILGTIDPTMPGRYATSKKSELSSAAAKLCSGEAIVEPAIKERALAWLPPFFTFTEPVAQAGAGDDDGGDDHHQRQDGDASGDDDHDGHAHDGEHDDDQHHDGREHDSQGDGAGEDEPDAVEPAEAACAQAGGSMAEVA
ncbi:ParB/RepB/Spo0J family partition protein [Novosphingobium terrae]|uniref:ParB/RepB/Spo0J family partition protein n=1 Tax=Novosphingobium terrae TaxID=2726189 RepID=UPI00197EA581|nr:ParB/RepB/Spo0J family partition protein [Novosphingobium terrae]